MAGTAAEDFNHRIIGEFRASGGRVGGQLAGTPMLLLHHIGARSGIERVTPLAYRPHGDGRYVIVASNGGSPTHPAWYHNLKANPVVEVEVGTETFTAYADELEAAAHHPLWSELVAESASLREYQTKTARRIPMLMLTRSHSVTMARSSSAPRARARRERPLPPRAGRPQCSMPPVGVARPRPCPAYRTRTGTPGSPWAPTLRTIQLMALFDRRMQP